MTDDETKAELIRLFEAGELVPIGRIKAFKSFSAATAIRWAMAGKIPSIRLGKRILTHESLVRDALLKCVIGAPPTPQEPQAS